MLVYHGYLTRVPRIMDFLFLHIIVGAKTQAFFDVWSIEHVFSGISVGHAVRKSNSSVFKNKAGLEAHQVRTKYFDVVAVLFLAYLWETIEHYLETGLLGARVEYWFQGVEFWGNRIIADPLLIVVGYLIAKKYPQLVIPARCLSVAWLFMHVFIFPHSMYLSVLLGLQ